MRSLSSFSSSSASTPLPLHAQAGKPVQLLPERALWWPAGQALFVADLHLGKAATFPRRWACRCRAAPRSRTSRGSIC